MQLIQLMPLIQFNFCYTLHSNTNNNRPSNNLLVIDFMLLIQFMLLIIGDFVTEICAGKLRRQPNSCGLRPKGPRITARRGQDQGPKGRRSVVALLLSSWYVAPSEASAAKMEAAQAPMGYSLAYDRVIFHKVTFQVMNLLVEVDGLLLENGSPLSHANRNDLNLRQ